MALVRLFIHCGADLLQALGKRHAAASPRHFHHAKLRHRADTHRLFVAGKSLIEGLQNRFTVEAFGHIDEVNGDQPAKATQPDLPRNDLGGFLINRARRCVVIARIDINRCHGLRGFKNYPAA